jgi:hypothetical protein
MEIELTHDNYIGVAMKYYDNIECNTIEEFNSDLYRIVCVKKIIDRYLSSGKVNIRLLLNHVIILHNSFGPLAEKLLKLRLDQKYHPAVKSILVFLKYIESDDWHEVYEDVEILNELRKI